MTQESSPNDSIRENEADLEEQLARYAKDLQELFLERMKLEKNSTESQRLVQLRGGEISALNDFVRRRLEELFDLQAAYAKLLDQLEGTLDWIQPPQTRETIRKCVLDARPLLRKIQDGR